MSLFEWGDDNNIDVGEGNRENLDYGASIFPAYFIQTEFYMHKNI